MDENNNSKYNESKTGIGVLCGLFLGILGLIIGVCLYPAGTVARQSFMKAWLWTFFTAIVVVIIYAVIVYSISGTY